MKFGIIEEGKLKGQKIILEPRNGLKNNEYIVEKGVFNNGAQMFQKACLVCEEYIGEVCTNCKN